MTVGIRLLLEPAQKPPEKSSLLIRDEVEAVHGISGVVDSVLVATT
jgi:hypothetical protein